MDGEVADALHQDAEGIAASAEAVDLDRSFSWSAMFVSLASRVGSTLVRTVVRYSLDFCSVSECVCSPSRRLLSARRTCDRCPRPSVQPPSGPAAPATRAAIHMSRSCWRSATAPHREAGQLGLLDHRVDGLLGHSRSRATSANGLRGCPLVYHWTVLDERAKKTRRRFRASEASPRRCLVKRPSIATREDRESVSVNRSRGHHDASPILDFSWGVRQSRAGCP